MGESIDLKFLARKTIGFNGADIANMVNQAALAAARQVHYEMKVRNKDQVELSYCSDH